MGHFYHGEQADWQVYMGQKLIETRNSPLLNRGRALRGVVAVADVIQDYLIDEHICREVVAPKE